MIQCNNFFVIDLSEICASIMHLKNAIISIICALSFTNAQLEKNHLVEFFPESQSIIKSFSQRRFITRTEKISLLADSLEENAETSQKLVTDFLSSNGIKYQTIWLTNQLLVKIINSSVIALIEKFQNVKQVTEDYAIPLDEIQDLEIQQGRREGGVIEWNVQMVRAEEAHHLILSMGITLPEIRLASIDTGVMYAHEALRDNFLGKHGWFDPHELSDVPIDYSGHGTHVTGTMVGNKGIGVFPQGKWMACRGCFDNTCDISALLLCAQFILCPTMPDMTERNCSKAPHIVNNSWGSTIGGLAWFDVVLEAWHEAGIIPVFSAGNAGSNCSTVGSPGDRDVISVGATTSNETIAYFSSRGPSVDGKLKPEVSAPGHLILSSYIGNNDSYAIASGTSMSSPCVSGVIGLMLAANPTLTYQEVKNHLEGGVDTRTLMSEAEICNTVPDIYFPNFQFGHGRVNAFKGVTSILVQNDATTAPPDSGNSANNNIYTPLLSFVALFVAHFFRICN